MTAVVVVLVVLLAAALAAGIQTGRAEDRLRRRVEVLESADHVAQLAADLSTMTGIAPNEALAMVLRARLDAG